MRNVSAIDSTGLHTLGEMVHRTRRDGSLILLSDVHSQPMIALGRSDLLDDIGEDCIFGNLDDALERARQHLGLAPAAGGTVPAEKVKTP
ncbi:MAG: STAS domain-containing protein [Longimicrobiales bacterium]